jgi:proteasome lid subunit RPN8/RPN11
MMMDSKKLSKVYISKKVIQGISHHIANRPPESGGLLMGPPNKDAITFFQYDQSGSTSGVTYTPDAKALNKIAQDVQSKYGWIVKGIIHSHPGSMSSLSSGDQQTIKEYFQNDNCGLPYFIAPIVYRKSGDQSNAVDVKGTYCNSMVIHVIHKGELDDKSVLNRTIEVEEFTDLQTVPNSVLPFNSILLSPREKKDIEIMKSKAPNAKPEYIEDGVVWSEKFNEKSRKYELSYWFDNNESCYKAAIIEGLRDSNFQSIDVSPEGLIDITRDGQEMCKEALNARSKAIDIIHRNTQKQKIVRTWPMIKLLYIGIKEATPIIILIILVGILFALWNISYLLSKPNVPNLDFRGSIQGAEIDKYFDSMREILKKDDALTKKDSTLALSRELTINTLNNLGKKPASPKDILVFLYDSHLVGFYTENNRSCQISPTISLDKANLRNVDLSQEKFSCINLSGAYLNKSNLSKSTFIKANFESADLQGAVLQDTNLQGANLRGANLTENKTLTFKQIKSTCNWKDAVFKSDNNQQKEFIKKLENDKSSESSQNNC